MACACLGDGPCLSLTAQWGSQIAHGRRVNCPTDITGAGDGLRLFGRWPLSVFDCPMRQSDLLGKRVNCLADRAMARQSACGRPMGYPQFFLPLWPPPPRKKLLHALDASEGCVGREGSIFTLLMCNVNRSCHERLIVGSDRYLHCLCVV